MKNLCKLISVLLILALLPVYALADEKIATKEALQAYLAQCREQALAVFVARERLSHIFHREPTLSELAAETGMSVEEIAAAELATMPPESLQQELAEGLTLEATLDGSEGEEEMVEKIALRSAVELLPESEKRTILLRFFKGLTQAQTARILAVSQVQVSRLERRALERLRKEFALRE